MCHCLGVRVVLVHSQCRCSQTAFWWSNFFWQSLSRHKFSLDSTELSSHLTHVNMCRKKCITDLLVRVLPPWVISDAAWRKTTQVERSTVTIFQDLSGWCQVCRELPPFYLWSCFITSSGHCKLRCSHLNGVIRKINSFSYSIVNHIDNPSAQPTRHHLSLIQNESHQYQAVELRLKSDFEFHMTSKPITRVLSPLSRQFFLVF